MKVFEGLRDELIQATWRDSYNRELEALWFQVVALTNNLHILRKLVTFPAGLLGVPDQPLLPILERALFESSILAISRIAVDSRSDSLTLGGFRTSILANCRPGPLLDQFARELDAVQFDSRMVELQVRLKRLRNKKLAHLDIATVRDPGILAELQVTLGELEDACSVVQQLITVLSLDAGREFYYPEYSPNINRRPEDGYVADVDHMLRAWAAKGSVLNMPEEQPAFWEYYRGTLSEGAMQILREYRELCGLPAI